VPHVLTMDLRCTERTLNNFMMEKKEVKRKEAPFSIGPIIIYCINLIPDVSSNYQLGLSINFIRFFLLQKDVLLLH
jgi:hypothetical protein